MVGREHEGFPLLAYKQSACPYMIDRSRAGLIEESSSTSLLLECVMSL